jgi:hypothetical protein
MAFQTTIPQNPVLGLPGQVSDDTLARDTITVFAEVDSTPGAPLEDPIPGILPGRLVVRGTEFLQARLPHALAADVDAIIVAGVSSAAPQDLGAIDFDGVVGATRWPVPTLVDAVFSANTDWDATNMTITGIGEDGGLITEVIAIPADVGGTVSTTNRFTQITRVQIDAQTGAGGTYTLGVQGPAAAALSKGLIQGIADLDQYREGTFDLNGVSVGPDGLPYADTVEFGAHNFNKVWVDTQDQVLEGAPAFVRIVNTAAAGAPSNCGQFRSDADAGNAVAVPGARYLRVEGTLAEVRVNFRD